MNGTDSNEPIQPLTLPREDMELLMWRGLADELMRSRMNMGLPPEALRGGDRSTATEVRPMAR